MTLLENIFLYWLRGMVLAWVGGSVSTVKALMPCFVISCSILNNVACLSVAVSVIRVPSLGLMW